MVAIDMEPARQQQPDVSLHHGCGDLAGAGAWHSAVAIAFRLCTCSSDAGVDRDLRQPAQPATVRGGQAVCAQVPCAPGSDATSGVAAIEVARPARRVRRRSHQWRPCWRRSCPLRPVRHRHSPAWPFRRMVRRHPAVRLSPRTGGSTPKPPMRQSQKDSQTAVARFISIETKRSCMFNIFDCEHV